MNTADPMEAAMSALIAETLRVPGSVDDRFLTRVRSRLDAAPRRLAWRAIAAAALVAVAIGLMLSSGRDARVVRTTADATSVVLPDRSVIHLHPWTELAVRPRLVDMRRGTADFHVAPGASPFRVVTPPAEVRVLGTVFRLALSERALAITVSEGEVEISNAHGSIRVGAGGSATCFQDEPPRVSRHEAPLPDGAVARIGSATFAAHGGVMSLAFSPDGKIIAAGDDGGRANAWSAPSGKPVFSAQAVLNAAESVSFSPDGKRLVVSGSSTIVTMDAVSGARTESFDTGSPVINSTFSAQTPDGKLIAGFGADWKVTLWSAATKEVVRSFEFAIGDALPTALCVSPKGAYVAAAASDGRVTAWRIDGGKPVFSRTIGGGEGDELFGQQSLSLAFSPDESLLACGRESQGAESRATVHVWSLPDGAERHRLRGHDLEAGARTVGPEPRGMTVAFRPDGTMLASAGRDFTIRLWDVAREKVVRTLSTGRMTYALAFSPDGKTLASGDAGGRVRLWDPDAGTEMPGAPLSLAGITRARFSPDGSRIALGQVDDDVTIVDAKTLTPVARLAGKAPRRITGLAWARDGKSLMTSSWNGTSRVWDLEGPVMTFEYHPSIVTPESIAFAADGRPAVSKTEDGSTVFWPAESAINRDKRTWGARPARAGQVIANGSGHDTMSSADFTEDGRWAIVEGRLYAVGSGREAMKIDRAERARFSPDGRLLALPFTDELWIVDVATGRKASRVEAKERTAFAFSRDSRVLAVGSGTDVLVFDAVTGGTVATLKGHAAQVTDLDFSPDGRALVTASTDTTALLWKADTARWSTAKKPEAKEREALWDSLGHAEPKEALAAAMRLAADPGAAAFVRERTSLKEPAEDVTRVVDRLASDDLGERERAQKELEGASDRALLEALAGTKSPEAKARIEAVLAARRESLPASGRDLLRRLRAVLVLERAGGAESLETLKLIAARGSYAMERADAESALERMR